MRKIHFVLFISVASQFISCNNKKEVGVVKPDPCENAEVTSASYFMEKMLDPVLMDSLENLALNEGDTLAYNELKQIHYIGQQRFTSFLYYALIMSDKFNYKTASSDVYFILTYNKQISDNGKIREMANSYLLKSK